MEKDKTLKFEVGEGIFYSPRVLPINISFAVLGELVPKEDITPLEAVHISILLTAVSSVNVLCDIVAFVKEHKLERHFTKED